MAQSLAVRYRPSTFDEILGQKSVIRILKRQVELRQFAHCYLFAGLSGSGKTTSARALAREINNNQGSPIEIDGASNSGVEAVRAIINSAKERSIDSEYKIFIIDECHALSSASWQAFLKCIEEPPEYTIFMFCTTNPEKIPPTILNRCMRFNITKVPTVDICNRLQYISQCEGYINYTEACDFISKISGGSARNAIAMLEKCAAYDNNISIENVLACLGNFSFDALFDLTAAILNNDQGTILDTIESYYDSGNDLKILIEQYLDFALDLTKYCIFRSMACVKIPLSLAARCEGFANIPDSIEYSNNLVETLLNIKNMIKQDSNAYTTICAMLIKMARGD